MFGALPTVGPDSKAEWKAAAAHGATLNWALRATNTNVNVTATPDLVAGQRVGRTLRLASVVPISVIDELLADGWTPSELSSLRHRTGTRSFSETARHIIALNRAVPGIGGTGCGLRVQVAAAVMSAGSVNLTDLQMLRWLQALGPAVATGQDSGYFAFLDPPRAGSRLQEWLAAAGPDGWAWAAAGYTPAETQVLLGLPETHPNRPGPEQLAVMAALRT